MLALVNISGGECSIDSMCMLLGVKSQINLTINEDELRSMHPDVVELLDRNKLKLIVVDTTQVED